jgi:hypothetical protein
VFQKNIAKEEHHNDKSNKHDPTSGYVEIEQRTNNDEIKYRMQEDAKDAKC